MSEVERSLLKNTRRLTDNGDGNDAYGLKWIIVNDNYVL